MEKQKELSEKLKSRFQFLVTITLFFPVVFEALTSKANMSDTFSDFTLSWGMMMAILIFDYIFLELTKKWKYPIFLEAINIGFFLNMFCYAIVFILLAQMASSNILAMQYVSIFKLAFISLVKFPIIILAIFISNYLLLCASIVRKFFKI